MMGSYLQRHYRDAPQEARVEVVKFILYRLWVQQQIPHFLFSGHPYHVKLNSDIASKFSWPIRSLLMWEHYESDSPLVELARCHITLNFYDWRSAPPSTRGSSTSRRKPGGSRSSPP